MELVCDALLQSGWRCLAARASQKSSNEIKGAAFCFELFATAFTFLELQKGIYYEFIPFNESNFDEEGNLKHNPTCLTINEIEIGVDYALVITTCSGAWRYLLGDTIRFIHPERSEFIITGRMNKSNIS